MDVLEKQMLLNQVRSLEEQIRILRKEKMACEERIKNLEETVNKILENEGMLG